MARDRPTLTSERFEEAAKRLLPDEREVLALSACDGLTIAQVADRLGMAPEEAERLLAAALCRLDRALERQKRPWRRRWWTG